MFILTEGQTPGAGTYTKEADKNIVSAMIDGMLFPLTGDADTEALTKSEAFYGSLGWGIVGLITASKVTRSRLQADPAAKPVLGFLF